MSASQPRQPEGTPIGGRWAAKGHSEADAVALESGAGASTPDPSWEEIRDGYLERADYNTIEDWARDSDYTEQPEGSGVWTDEHGNPVDLEEQLLGALEAVGPDDDPLTSPLRRALRDEAASTAASAYERLTDNEDLDSLRRRDPDYPIVAHERAVGALRDLRDATAALAAGAPRKGEGGDRSKSSSFYDYQAARKQADEAAERLVDAAIAHVSELTRDAYPDAAMVVVRRDDDEFESLRPRFVLAADGRNISGTVNDPGRKQLEAWRSMVEDPIGEAGGHRDAMSARLEYAGDKGFEAEDFDPDGDEYLIYLAT
jgi:hypothetical protein